MHSGPCVTYAHAAQANKTDSLVTLFHACDGNIITYWPNTALDVMC